MSSKATVTVTVGVSGSGKTYYRCAVFLVDEWLPNHSGVLITNYPVNMENLLKDYPMAANRVELIPRDVLNSWRDGSSGPWDYFKDRDISGCHIAIDEIHNYCGKNTDNKIRKKWLQWLGELRHQGATCEFLTQSEAKCAKEILNEAEIRYEIINGENRIFPVLGYRMGDLYQFRAKLIGKYLCPSFCREYMQAGGKWNLQREEIFYRLPKYFQYYDSFSAPEHGKAQGHKGEKMPWEKYGWFMLFVWFFLTYPFRIMLQMAAIVLLVYMFFLGGCTRTVKTYFEKLEKIGNPKNVELKKNAENESSEKVVKSSNGYVVQASENEERKLTFPKVVRLKSYEVLTPYYLRLRSGLEFYSGDYVFDLKIVRFYRDGFIELDNGDLIPFSYLEE